MDRLVWIVSVFAMIALMLSCGSSEPTKEAPAGKATAPDATAVGSEGSVEAEANPTPPTPADRSAQATPAGDTTLPAGFPADVPMYDGGEIRSVSEETNDHKHVVQSFTKDPLATVTEHLSKAAGSKGWTEDTTVTQGDPQPMSILGFVKGNRKLDYMVTQEGDGTAIQITVQ